MHVASSVVRTNIEGPNIRRPKAVSMLSSVLWSVVALFPVSEIALAIFKRADASSARSEDRGSLRLLWVVITLSVLAAVACM